MVERNDELIIEAVDLNAEMLEDAYAAAAVEAGEACAAGSC